ncbi:cytochrome o ubiquinol oxidase subunit IV [Halomonas sp. PR-M31]|uniref:cytochrome o ubiquinol oxidase subunit IV n=1 Tax=Halomonas sp. PR-M31 TaxID=1471202 RepID=UPI0006514311|nr:cytochrome o ubiquinol oxidase subunit IV [Halomonas sp. PR-M31]
MSHQGLPISEDETLKGEFRDYCIGGVLALLLTMLAFALVAWNIFESWNRLISLSLLAIIQVIVHFRYFLHIDLRKSHRDELQLILFTGLILFLMAGGTVWILWNLHFRML